MPTRHRRRSRFRPLILPVVLTAVALYFGWQSTRGAFSQERREALAAERRGREAELAVLEARRASLERRVARLRSDALDADLLDERARSELFLARPDELVIFHAAPPEDQRTALLR
jgi:cell division protein FtsB